MGCACAAFLTPTVDRGLGERSCPDIPPLAEFALKRSRRFGLPNQAERREIRSLSHLRVGPHGGDSAFTEQNQAVAGLYGAEPMRDKSAGYPSRQSAESCRQRLLGNVVERGGLIED